jgi:hypothetical protein
LKGIYRFSEGVLLDEAVGINRASSVAKDVLALGRPFGNPLSRSEDQTSLLPCVQIIGTWYGAFPQY